MAELKTIGGNGTLFVGEDKVIRLELFDLDNPATAIDMAGMTMLFDVRKKDNSPDPAMVSITPTLTGVFNSSRTSNTQRALVVLTDTHMNLFKEATYRWSWKRMDADVETVLAWGPFTPQKATAP